MPYERNKTGIYYAIVAAFISGFSIFLNKYALSAITPAILFTGIKNFGVGILLFALINKNKSFKSILKLTKKQLINLVTLTVVGGTIPFYLFFTGLTQTSAINAAILQKTLIIWVALFAGIFLREKLTKTQVLGVGLIFASNFVIGGFNGIALSKGEIMILTSAIFWGLEYVLAKRVLYDIDPEIVAFFRMGLGSCMLLAATYIFFPTHIIKTDTNSLLWMGLSIALLTGYVLSWYKALKFAPAIMVTCVLTGSTIVTNILSALFVTQNLAVSSILQICLLIAGIWLAVATHSNNLFSLDTAKYPEI